MDSPAITSSVHEALLSRRDEGMAFSLRHPVAGLLPAHRCAIVELRAEFDPAISASHLLINTLLRDPLSGEICQSRRDACRALPLELKDQDRQTYVSEMCRIIYPYVQLYRLTLADLAPVVTAMNESWNILAAFQALDEIDQARLHTLRTPPRNQEVLPSETQGNAAAPAEETHPHLLPAGFTHAELKLVVAALEQQESHARARVQMKKALALIHDPGALVLRGDPHGPAQSGGVLSQTLARARLMLAMASDDPRP